MVIFPSKCEVTKHNQANRNWYENKHENSPLDFSVYNRLFFDLRQTSFDEVEYRQRSQQYPQYSKNSFDPVHKKVLNISIINISVDLISYIQNTYHQAKGRY